MTGCSYPSTYDGIGADEYMEWKIAIDNIFATRFMCPRRKVKMQLVFYDILLYLGGSL
jgi:hypothetical protein